MSAKWASISLTLAPGGVHMKSLVIHESYPTPRPVAAIRIPADKFGRITPASLPLSASHFLGTGTPWSGIPPCVLPTPHPAGHPAARHKRPAARQAEGAGTKLADTTKPRGSPGTAERARLQLLAGAASGAGDAQGWGSSKQLSHPHSHSLVTL